MRQAKMNSNLLFVGLFLIATALLLLSVIGLILSIPWMVGAERDSTLIWCLISLLLGFDANRPPRVGENNRYKRSNVIKLVAALGIQIVAVITGGPLWWVLPFTGFVISISLIKIFLSYIASLRTADEAANPN
jgi:hypothetical protein